MGVLQIPPIWENKVVDTDTWKVNSIANEGVVSPGAGHFNTVWMTNGSGEPTWRSLDGSSVGLNNVANIDVQSSFTQDNGAYFSTEKVVARDNDGIEFYDNDEILAIQIKDGGFVGINKINPSSALDIYGTTTSTYFSGNGTSLTNLNGTSISSGTISNSRLNSATTSQAGITQLTDSYSGTSSTVATTQKALNTAMGTLGSMATQNNNDVNITGGTISNVTSIGVTGTTTSGLFSGSGASLTSLNASNISSGTVSNSRLTSATTAQAGITQLTDSYSGTSSTLATTQKALNTAMGTLGSMAIQNNNAVNIDGGTVEGLSMIKSTQGEIETLRANSISVTGNTNINGDVTATNLTVDTITYKSLVQDSSSIELSNKAIEFAQPLRAPNPMVDTYLAGSSRGNWVTATWVKNTFHIGNMISDTDATQLKIPVTGVYLVRIEISIGGNCESYLKIYKEDGSVRTTLASTAHNGSSLSPAHVISINEPYYLIAGDYIMFDFYSRSVHSNNITTTLSSADYMKIMYLTSSDTN